MKKSLDVSSWKKRFHEAMNDDLNTKKALEVLESLSREIVKVNRKKSITEAKAFFTEAFNILGLTIEYI